MYWNEYIDFGPKPKPTRIHVRQLGIPKFVYVRTRKNGGIREEEN